MSNRIKGVAAYLLIAFGLAWINLWVAGRFCFLPGCFLLRLVTLPGAFAPAIAAFVVRKWITREGFGDAGLALNLRKKWPYYLIAWFFPGIAVLLIFPLAAVAGARLPWPIPPNILSVIPRLPAEFILGAVLWTPLAWGEEFGWRGYLQIRLLAHRPVLAAVATGLVWAAWHYALNLEAYIYPGQHFLRILAFPVTLILASIILGWLRERTGSVGAPALYHAAGNASNGSATMSSLLGAMTGRGWDWPVVGWVLALIPTGVLCAWIVLSGRREMEGLHEEADS